MEEGRNEELIASHGRALLIKALSTNSVLDTSATTPQKDWEDASSTPSPQPSTGSKAPTPRVHVRKTRGSITALFSSVLSMPKSEEEEVVVVEHHEHGRMMRSSISSIFTNAFSTSHKPCALTQQEAKLEALMFHSECKRRLLHSLLLDGDCMVKIRFFSAVSEVLRETDRSEHERKKLALVKIFFHNGFTNTVPGLPPALEHEISALKSSGVARAQKVMAEDLLKNALVLQALGAFEASAASNSSSTSSSSSSIDNNN